MSTVTTTEHGEVVNITPHECSVKGGEQLVLTFCNPVAVPDDESIFLYFGGSQDSHKVPTSRLSPNSLMASIPSHSTAETVELKLCCMDENHQEKSLYKTSFTYFSDQKAGVVDQKASMADMMLQSACDGLKSLDELLPPLSSTDALREYDMFLMDALSEREIPEGWSMVGGTGREGRRVSTVQDCEPQDTLLHFAARHGFNSLTQHLLSLPGSSIAAVLPNQEGKCPIQIAKENNNEGLVQLLALYMKQVGLDGKFVVSPSPSPKDTPNHVVDTLKVGRAWSSPMRGEDKGGGEGEEHYAILLKQIQLMGVEKTMQEMMRINEEWRNQVKRHRKCSLGSLTFGESDVITQQTRKELKPAAECPPRLRRRRNSCAFISVSSRPDVGVATHYLGGQQLECVSRMQDPEVLEMDRRRKISWSATVGSTDSRSVDTGLNELYRITAEEGLQERLLYVRTELTEMERATKSPNHQCHNQSQLNLRSLSCPLLADSDVEDESASPFGLASPTGVKRLSKASSTSAMIISQDLHDGEEYHHSPHHVIPKVITTKYSMESLLSDQANSGLLHGDPNSMATSAESMDDVGRSSLDHQDSQGSEEYAPREQRSISLLEAQLDEDSMAAGFSISAPDLLILSEDDLENVAENQPDFKPRPAMSVEESIVEHRTLRQMSNYSPVSDELRDTGTDHTNTSVDSDFVMVTSPSQQASRDPQEFEQLSQSVDVIKRSNKPAHVKTHMHRRSLSTSDVEAIREARKSAELKEEQVEETKGRVEERNQRPNTTANCIAVLTPISNNDETSGQGTPSYSRKMDVDEHSQADSVQTLDTNSQHGSDDSSDEENRETDDQLSALESQVSLEPIRSESHLNPQARQNGVSNLSPVVLRTGKRRAINPLNRYSAEYLITNIDDDITMESDDGEATPTSLLNRFSHRRINSTSIPLSTVGHSDDPTAEELEEDDHFDGDLDHSMDTFVVPNGSSKNLSLSMRSNDSVFLNSMDGDVVNLSDVDVKVNSDEGAPRSLEASCDISFEQSSELDERYYKQTGSPKTIRKKFSKSPLSRRRATQKSEKSEKSEEKGLKKADVSPTIRTLRKLLVLDEKEDYLSDDSDTTIGSGPARTSSALERTSVVSVQRTGSSVSDSVTLQQQHRNPTPSFGTVPSHRSASPSSSGMRSPLLQQANPTANLDVGSSLDFVPGSPLATRKTQQITNTSIPPASPLSFSQTKSPPASTPTLTTLADVNKRQSNNSSPALSSSPTPGNVTPNMKLEEEELQDETQPTKANPVQSMAQRHKIGKFEKSKSLFESGTEPAVFFVDPKDPPREVYEGKDKEHESTVIKRFIRGSLFRGSKQNSKKITKATTIARGASENEEVQESPPNPSSKRAKSAKLRTKPSDISMEPLPSSPSGSITRSTSMQVGLEEAAEIQANTKRRSTQYMTRYNSDDTLTSPSKMRNAHSLTILEEKEYGGKSVGFPLSPTTQGSGGESDNEEITSMEQLGLTADHPELHLKEEVAWERTVDRKVYRKINKAERERQAILHELLHTEKQHFRALHVLKLIFRHGISKRVSEEALDQLFPKLDELIEISKDFIKRMERKRGGSSMINDLSDVLLCQFSDNTYDQMLSAFSGFCSGHLNAMEIYRELLKKRSFNRLMNEMHSLKECHRLTLPDYYTKVTQRLSQLITLMNRLAKKTESLKLDHYPVLRQSMLRLQQLVAAVDQSVEDRKNLMEVMDIQSRLEINVPKSSKVTNRQDLKSLCLTAHNRLLRKRGDATWMGHGRQLGVQIVLVTDFLVLLTERDQKFHLASLQDLKPPVIRLYDLMVRSNVSVKSGVQLLLVEQSSTPEMYKLDFADKRKAKQWLNLLNGAIEECREKGLKCEFFGAERVQSGDEDKKHSEDKEGESGEEGKALAEKPNIFPSKSDPGVQRHNRAKETMEVAQKLLSTVNSFTADQSMISRHHDPVSGVPTRVLNLRQRSQTVRPKTTFFDDTDGGGSPATIAGYASTSGDHVISYPQLISKGSKVKEKKKVNRSSTFRSKEKKEEKEKEKPAAGGVSGSSQGNHLEDSSRVSEQLYISCITALKSSLEEIMNESDEKNKTISKLHEEVRSLTKALKAQHHKGKRKEHMKTSPRHPSPLSDLPPPAPAPSTVGVNTKLGHSPDQPLPTDTSKSNATICTDKDRETRSDEEGEVDGARQT